MANISADDENTLIWLTPSKENIYFSPDLTIGLILPSNYQNLPYFKSNEPTNKFLFILNRKTGDFVNDSPSVNADAVAVSLYLAKRSSIENQFDETSRDYTKTYLTYFSKTDSKKYSLFYRTNAVTGGFSNETDELFLNDETRPNMIITCPSQESDFIPNCVLTSSQPVFTKLNANGNSEVIVEMMFLKSEISHWRKIYDAIISTLKPRIVVKPVGPEKAA